MTTPRYWHDFMARRVAGPFAACRRSRGASANGGHCDRGRMLAFFAAALLSAAAAADGEFVEYVGASGGVNWSAGAVQAEGVGVGPENLRAAQAGAMACRAAMVDAQRNLLESIQGVRVEGTTVVQDMMVANDTVRTTVQGVLQGARVVRREPQADGSCIIAMEAPMGGALATAVYDEAWKGDTQAMTTLPGAYRVREALAVLVDAGLATIIAPVRAAQTEPWRADLDRVAARLSALEDLVSTHPGVTARTGGATGVVIDARGSNFIPSMSPTIRRLRDEVIYPNAKHQASRRERGQLVSLFTRNLDTARRHPVVGERPVVLKALRTFGDSRTGIVLADDSADELSALVGRGLLDDAGVIIVL